MRKTITTTLVVAAAATAVSGAGIALASTHGGATTGTESFQMMSTSGTSPHASLIARGVFTAPGVDTEQAHNTATFAFPNGTVRVKHSGGTGPQSFNPKTCLLTTDQHGTYQLTGGTGKYAGISGHGRYALDILAIAQRSGGKCSQSKPPAAFHQVINATGPVSLP